MGLTELREAAASTLEEWRSAHDALAALDGDDQAATDVAQQRLDECKATHERARAQLEDAIALDEAKRSLPDIPEPETAEETRTTSTVDVRVKREELTYEPHKRGVSFFGDLAAIKTGESTTSTADEARERLLRHAQEMEVEQRAISTTDGTGGEFVPPLWLQNQWIKVQRAGRVFANSVNNMPLPPGTDTINLPKVATGTAAAVQTDGGTVTATDLTTTSVTGAVQTIAGQQDVSMQLVDFSVPGIDQVIADDLLRVYAQRLDILTISGNVTNAKGVLNVASINTSTFTSASPTVALFYPKLLNAIQLIATTRFAPATHIAMHPVRWAWILAAIDSQNRPLVVPNGNAFNQPGTSDGNVAEQAAAGTIAGLPVYLDANIPTNLGAGTNEDRVIVYRGDDLYLYGGGSPRFRVLEEVLSGTLQVRFQAYGYYATIFGRYPGAISVISGTGLTAPTF